jgi:hypothetical protein
MGCGRSKPTVEEPPPLPAEPQAAEEPVAAEEEEQVQQEEEEEVPVEEEPIEADEQPVEEEEPAVVEEEEVIEENPGDEEGEAEVAPQDENQGTSNEGVACEKPGTWQLENDEGWVSCLSVPEKPFTRPIVATWFGWNPSKWTEEEWQNNISGTHPITATKEHYTNYKVDAPSPSNRLLKKISQKCGVLVNVSDIQAGGKYAETRFITFQAKNRFGVEKACNAFLESIPPCHRLYIAQGGNRYGQMYDDSLDLEKQDWLKTNSQWITCLNARDSIFYTEQASRKLRNTMSHQFGDFISPTYAKAV